MSAAISERSQMHAAVDQYLAAGREFVSLQSVAAAIGSETVRQFIDFSRNYIVPNLQHGRIALSPSQLKEDGCVVVATAEGTEITVDKSFHRFTPGQEDAATEFLTGHGFAESAAQQRIAGYQRWNDDDEELGHITGSRGEHAGIGHYQPVFSDVFPSAPDQATRLLATLRPAIFINSSQLKPDSRDDTLLHEFEHVVTVTAAPLAVLDASQYAAEWHMFSDEDPAYTVACKALGALLRSGYCLTEEQKRQPVARDIVRTMLRERSTITINPYEEFERRLVAAGLVGSAG